MSAEHQENRPNSRQIDLGFSVDQTNTLIEGLNRLMKLPTIPDYVVADALHELEDNQLAYAKQREDKSLGKKIDRWMNNTRTTRRKLLKGGVTTTAAVGVAGGSGYGFFKLIQAWYDADGSTASDRKYEQTHTLGTEPSATSISNYNIRYAGANDPVDFVVDATKDATELKDMDEIKFGKIRTRVYVHDYKISDGSSVPELKVDTRDNGAQTDDFDNKLLISNGKTDINPHAIIFQNADDQTEMYVQVTRKVTNPVTFEVQPMKKVPKQ